MNAITIIFDEYCDVSSIHETIDMETKDNNIPFIFGKKIIPTEQMEILFKLAPCNAKGNANKIINSLFRKTDLSGKYIETKREFLKREMGFYTKILKRRQRR